MAATSAVEIHTVAGALCTQHGAQAKHSGVRETEKDREEREIHYVHSASLAYEDGIVFMSEPFAASATLCHMYRRMHPAASWKRPGDWALISLK